jgi:hypothetical protein
VAKNKKFAGQMYDSERRLLNRPDAMAGVGGLAGLLVLPFIAVARLIGRLFRGRTRPGPIDR